MCLKTITEYPRPEIDGYGYKVFSTSTYQGFETLYFHAYGLNGMSSVPRGQWLTAQDASGNGYINTGDSHEAEPPFASYKPGFHIYLHDPQVDHWLSKVVKVRFRKGHTIGMNAVPPYGERSRQVRTVIAEEMYVPTAEEMAQPEWGKE